MSGELSARHAGFIVRLIAQRECVQLWSKKHIEMNGYFWCVNALHVLQRASIIREGQWEKWLIPFIYSCQNTDGGFAAFPGGDSSIAATLCALQLLVLLQSTDVLVEIKEKAIAYVRSLRQADGSFLGEWQGEADMQYVYSALYCLHILGGLRDIDGAQTVEYIRTCLNWDGAFGHIPQSESHAGPTFCALAALEMLQRVDALSQAEKTRAGQWLSQRQSGDGGLCGRPNKKSDTCYSWWVFASLCILGQSAWIDVPALVEYISRCQDNSHGGFADKPGRAPDPYHTFFSIASLALMQEYEKAFEASFGEIWRLDEMSVEYALPRGCDRVFLT
ncbi:geranylgeranyl transferase type II beta subunit [Perkinsela sp. CCAP 1560/4]|nr:geranylgeranyl transferase type II beta subunit [Perkinsela sp. CCAP 1560/4]|eukprot:KNH04831.1 geranylgeranyl transferase type II beta subunit [Perkinsela sp. CCAP 1560/4]